MTSDDKTPDAEILINTGCAHCPAVLAGLTELSKKGLIGELTVINVAVRPEAAAERRARSVPWTRIGPFVLEGSYRPSELREWAERAATEEGMGKYFGELLENQKLDEALALLRNDRSQMQTLVDLIGNLETPMGVRIGVGAMFESLAEKGELDAAIEGLGQLTEAEDSQVRADAAYYLGLIDSNKVRKWLDPLLEDDNHEVREIAAESLAD